MATIRIIDHEGNRIARERRHAAGKQSYETHYIARQFGVPEVKVKAAIEKIGNDRKTLVAHFQSKTRTKAVK